MAAFFPMPYLSVTHAGLFRALLPFLNMVTSLLVAFCMPHTGFQLELRLRLTATPNHIDSGLSDLADTFSAAPCKSRMIAST